MASPSRAFQPSTVRLTLDSTPLRNWANSSPLGSMGGMPGDVGRGAVGRLAGGGAAGVLGRNGDAVDGRGGTTGLVGRGVGGSECRGGAHRHRGGGGGPWGGGRT